MAPVLRSLLAAVAALLLVPAAAMRDENMHLGVVKNDAAGVSDTIQALVAEIAQQISMGETSLKDTTADRERKEAELAQVQAERVVQGRWYRIWNHIGLTSTLKMLDDRIRELGEDVRTLQGLEQTQGQELEALKNALKTKGSAAELSAALEMTIEDLTQQIEEKRALRDREIEEDQREVELAQEQAKAKVQIFARMITDVAVERTALTETRAKLLEAHTSTDCAEKEHKGESICHRCSGETKACGNQCIPKEETCHFSADCACDEATGESLAQLADATHPLRQRIASAKAALRKVIAQHETTMKELAADIASNEQEKRATEMRRADAAQEFDGAIKILEATLTKARAALEEARAAKEHAEGELAQVTSDGEEQLAQLAREIEENERNLEAELVKAREAKTDQMKVNKEQIEALLDAQAVARNQLEQEIEQLVEARDEAQARLAEVAAKHIE